MLGWITLGYGVATVVAVVIALCGPSQPAKYLTFYVLSSWILYTAVHVSLSRTQQSEFNGYMDFVGAMAAISFHVIRPRWWSLLIFCSLLGQSAIHVIYYSYEVPEDLKYEYDLSLNLLYIPQLVAITIPTWAKWYRRLKRRLSSAGRATVL